MNPPDQPTPRTNAIAHRGYPEPAYIVEMTDLARILERELTETERLRFGADADRRRLRAEVEQLNLELEANKLKGGGCQCSDDEACAHVPRREKAEADTARLNWLEHQANVSFGRCIASPEDHDAPAFAITVGLLNRKRSFPAKTFRAAIDAAMKETINK